jgi:protein phosphatase
VSEDEIVRIVTTYSSPAEACQFLVEAANEAGGPDNITAILVRVPG